MNNFFNTVYSYRPFRHGTKKVHWNTKIIYHNKALTHSISNSVAFGLRFTCKRRWNVSYVLLFWVQEGNGTCDMQICCVTLIIVKVSALCLLRNEIDSSISQFSWVKMFTFIHFIGLCRPFYSILTVTILFITHTMPFPNIPWYFK